MSGHHLPYLQMHFRYENARRDRVYGKHVPNTRVDTSELADRVSAITFLEDNNNSSVNGPINLTGARLPLRRVTQCRVKIQSSLDRAWAMHDRPRNCAYLLMKFTFAFDSLFL
jgi:hypothetical protein